jgi:hypothetical protein
MDFKDILKIAAGPFGLMLLGGYVGYRYGTKLSIHNKLVGAGTGAVAGYAASQALSKLLTPATTTTTAEQQAAALDAAQKLAEQEQTLRDYVSLGAPRAPMPTPLALPPHMRQVAPRQQPILQTSPANVRAGEGSYGGTSYNVEETEATMGEAEDLLAYKQAKGSN